MSKNKAEQVFYKEPHSTAFIQATQMLFKAVPAVVMCILIVYNQVWAAADKVSIFSRTVNLMGIVITFSLFWLWVTSYWRSRIAWLSRDCCGELADLIQRNSELQSYHEKVLAMGRRYTHGEYIDMKLWLHKRDNLIARARIAERQAADCRRLYQVREMPSPVSSPGKLSMSDTFNMKLLTETQIRNRRGLLIAAQILLAVMWVTFIFATDSTASFWQPNPVMGKTVVTALGLFIGGLAFWSVDALAIDAYGWLPREGCGALALECVAFPELQKYREAVCAQGRRFTVGEYRAMRHWASQQRQKASDTAAYLAENEARYFADCQRLYGLNARDSQLK